MDIIAISIVMPRTKQARQVRVGGKEKCRKGACIQRQTGHITIESAKWRYM